MREKIPELVVPSLEGFEVSSAYITVVPSLEDFEVSSAYITVEPLTDTLGQIYYRGCPQKMCSPLFRGVLYQNFYCMYSGTSDKGHLCIKAKCTNLYSGNTFYL